MSLGEIVNVIVVSSFGIVIGNLAFLYYTFTIYFMEETIRQVEEQKRAGQIQKDTEQGGTIRRLVKEIDARSEIMDELMKDRSVYPKSAFVVSVAIFGLVALLVFTVYYTALEMNWIIFVSTAVIGALMMKFAYHRGEKQRVTK